MIKQKLFHRKCIFVRYFIANSKLHNPRVRVKSHRVSHIRETIAIFHERLTTWNDFIVYYWCVLARYHCHYCVYEISWLGTRFTVCQFQLWIYLFISNSTRGTYQFHVDMSSIWNIIQLTFRIFWIWNLSHAFFSLFCINWKWNFLILDKFPSRNWINVDNREIGW